MAAAGQLSLTGSWSATINLLPTVGLDTALTLKAGVGGWTVGGTAEWLSTDGYVWQTLTAGGELGPTEVEFETLFGPRAPAYLYALSKLKVMISGIDLTFYSAHAGPTVPGYFFGGPSGGMVALAQADLGGLKVSAEVGFGARLRDFTITYSGVGTYTKTYPVDPFPGGLQFTYLGLEAKEIPLCCGITFDSKFTFTKQGFDALALTLKGIPLCCGISFDTAVTFTTTAKRVEVKPKWAGITGCLTVYGDARFVGSTWQGIEVYGFKVRCELAECNYLEFLTAFNVAKVEEILDEDIFQGPEFEYLRLGFCGPGCCGGKYHLTITAYFRPTGTLLGLQRLAAEAKVPLMANFTLNLKLGVTVSGPVSLALGWTFTF